MENKESILDELTNFEKGKIKEITPLLDEYLARIAKTGDTIFPWVKLKPLIKTKMEVVMVEFNETCPLDDYTPCPNVDRFTYDLMKEKLLEAVDKFNNSPFTIQRICELLTAPLQHYKRVDKFMRGLEKNVLVVSTVEPGCSHIFACDCARKRAEHNNSITVNGITESRTPLNGEETYTNPYFESGKISFQSSEGDDQSLPSPQTETNHSDPVESNEPLENGDKETTTNVADPPEMSAIESSSSCLPNSPPAEKKDEGSPTQSVDTNDEISETEKEETNAGYSSDDTVSSSTHCPATVETTDVTASEEAEVSESQKRIEDEQNDVVDEVSGNDTNAEITETKKCEDEIDSSSQDGEASIGVETDTTSLQSSSVVSQMVDEVNEPAEASSSEEESLIDESTDSSACTFHKDHVDTELVHASSTEGACLLKMEEEQPSSSSSSTMEPDDAARSSSDAQEDMLPMQLPATTPMQSSTLSEGEHTNDEAMDVVSVDTVASEMSEGQFSSIAKLPLSFELQPESTSPLSSLPSSPPTLSPNNDLECTSFSAASSFSPQVSPPNDEISTFSDSSLAGRSPQVLSSCTDIPEPMEED